MPDPGEARRPVGAGGLVFVLVLLAMVILILLWVPTAWLERVATVERAWARQALGARSAAAVVELAQRWSAAPLDVLPRGPEKLGTGSAVAALTDGLSPAWLADRKKAAARLVELVCLRVALLTAWGPALGLLLIVGVLDGHWRWRIRQLGFDYPSPVARQVSQAGLALVMSGLLLALLLPLPLHPCEIPLLALIAVRLIGTGITHLPKQL
ncbi:DUF4400 domain-containing protein [Thiorhodococcus minor]|nr:DUF4400 domain-containing protein [Thiorhodococcus minor]